jgi:glycogen synthase
MKVLFATAELSPLVRVGGLAAAAAGLADELRRQGVDLEIALPDYAGLALEGEEVVDLDVVEWARPARARRGRTADGLDVTLITQSAVGPYRCPVSKITRLTPEEIKALSASRRR